MYRRNSYKAPTTFHDVAACFSVEEWNLLHEWQQELYKNVMKEIHQALISMGPLIAASVFSLRAKENEDLCPFDHDDRERWKLTNPSPELPALNSDNVLKTEQSTGSLFDRCIRESCTKTNSVQVAVTPIFSLKIKEEHEDYSLEHEEPKIIETFTVPSDDASINRQRKEPFGNHTKENPSCKANLEKSKIVNVLHNSHNETNVDSQMLPQVSQELRRENTTRCEIGIHIPSDSILSQKKAILQINDNFKECESNRYVNILQYQSTLQQNKTRYSCTLCSKSFSAKKSVIRHHRTHTGERPFQCTECDKSFNQNGDLIRHLRSHSGEKPYHCTECGKWFSQKGNLRNHQKMHRIYPKKNPNLDAFS